MNEIIELQFNDFINKDLNSPLRKVSSEVLDINQSILDIIENLKYCFNLKNISVGLAAPQIGFNKRIILINLNKQENDDLILINPKIILNSGKTKESYESCLSLPNYKGKVKRKSKLILEYMDLKKNIERIEVSNFHARVILHEIDHLNGILFTDRITNINEIEII